MWNPWKKIKKLWFNLVNRPYLDMNISLKQNGSINIDAEYNGVFIYDLDRQYQNVEAFKNAQTDDEKVAMLAYDILYGIVQPILPPEEEVSGEEEDRPHDPYENIPPLAFRGGVENRQVVDIASLGKDDTDARKVDIRG